jgi:hypothetical protein
MTGMDAHFYYKHNWINGLLMIGERVAVVNDEDYEKRCDLGLYAGTYKKFDDELKENFHTKILTAFKAKF